MGEKNRMRKDKRRRKTAGFPAEGGLQMRTIAPSCCSVKHCQHFRRCAELYGASDIRHAPCAHDLRPRLGYSPPAALGFKAAPEPPVGTRRAGVG